MRRFLLLVLIFAGAACGLAAVGFHLLVDWMRELLIGPALAQRGALRIALVLGVPAVVSALIAVVIRRFAPAAGGANLARVRRAYELDPNILDARSVAATLALTPISLGAGAPLGPEGPTVVVASGLAMAIARWTRLPRRMIRGMIPVGTAAGIAAIFNTPITGVVFAMEEVMGSASRGVLGGTIIAAVAAAVVERMLLGGKPLLSAPSASWTDIRELVGFLVCGLIAGFVSGSSVLAIVRLRRALQRHLRLPVLRAAIGGLAIGGLGLLAPSILGVGYGTTSLFLHGGGTTQLAAIAFAAKVAGFLIAMASGIIGGTFAPSLFIGAALGSTVGHLAMVALPHAHVDLGAYALVGMGAFFAGFLRCPVSAVLIVFEVTGDYGLILPLMLAVAASTSLSRALAPHSLTELQMVEEGYEERASSDDPLAGLVVADVMTRDVIALPADLQLADAARLIADSHHRLFPVIDASRQVVGLLPRSSIDDGSSTPVSVFMQTPLALARDDETVIDAIRRMASSGIDRCAVVDANGRLAGFLSPSDLLRARMTRAAAPSDERDRDFDALLG
ncbi:MAG TPA: chloride channel protein [Thermoanaerobaculia bacterium]|nr:chloride channel protein [Thermoanaerobaculia bacterium]